jgi:hypothetical protein
MPKISAAQVKELRDMTVAGMSVTTLPREEITLAGPKKFDPAYDYNKDLKEDEFKHEKGRPFVYLRGLERLAKERGVQYARPTNVMQLGTSGVLVTYEYSFDDGRSYAGTADATTKNCDGNFKLYLSAMAESRAKARALRTAFGITTCSVEEKSNMTIAQDPELGPIGDEQIHLIKLKATELGLGKQDLFKMLEVPRNLTDLKKLTKEEALEILAALNKLSRKKKTRKTKKTTRKTDV